MLLGLVLERVTEKRFEQVLNDEVYRPAGMRRAGHFAPDGDEPNLAIGYRAPDRRGRHETGWVVIVLANHEGAADEFAGFVHGLVTR